MASTDTRHKKVVSYQRVLGNGRPRKEKRVEPALPWPDRYHRPATHQQTIQNVSQDFFKRGVKTTFRLESSAMHRVKTDIWLTFDILVASEAELQAVGNDNDATHADFAKHRANKNGVYLPPIWHWFDRIQVRAQSGQVTLMDIWPEHEYPIRLASRFKQPDDFADYARFMNCHKTIRALNPTVAGAAGQYCNWLAPGSTHRFQIPIAPFFKDAILEGCDDIFFDLTPKRKEEVPGLEFITIQNNPLFIVPTDAVTPQDAYNALALRNQAVMSRRFIEFVKCDFLGQTINRGAPFLLDLDSFSGKSAGLLVRFEPLTKSDGSETEGDQYAENPDDHFDVPIPKDVKVDIKNAGGRSELGLGTEPRYDLVLVEGCRSLHKFLRHIQPENLGKGEMSDANEVGDRYRWLLVPFTDDVGLALTHGVASGCRHWTGDRDQLELKFQPDPAGLRAGGSSKVWDDSRKYNVTVFDLRYRRINRWANRWTTENM